MNNLLSINNAAHQIKNFIGSSKRWILVIGIDKSGCSGYSYKLDFGRSSDLKNFEIVKKNGVKVLIDPKAIMFILGSTMDYKTDKLSSRFIFENPNEKSTCGCGESFSI